MFFVVVVVRRWNGGIFFTCRGEYRVACVYSDLLFYSLIECVYSKEI